MNKYELVYIIDTAVEDEGRKALIDRFNAVTVDDVCALSRETLADEAQSLSALGRLSDPAAYRALVREQA